MRGFARFLLMTWIAANQAIAADGDLDLTFGNGGKTFFSFPPPKNFHNSPRLAEAPDGNLYLFGLTAGDGGFNALAIARLLPNGNLDNSFDGDGKRVLTPLPGVAFYPYQVLVQADGRLLVSGARKSDPFKTALCRFTAGGDIDASFGGQPANPGCYVTGLDGCSVAYAVALQDDGKIVATVDLLSSDQAAVLRLTTEGVPDLAFSDDGYVALPNANGLRSIVVTSDGNYVVGGWHYSSPPYANADFYVARIAPTQSALDPGFNNGTGEISVGFDLGVAPTTKDDVVEDMEVLRDGSILLVGRVDIGMTDSDYSARAAVLKLTPEGVPDNTFGQNGKVLTSFNGDYLYSAIAVQCDGRILVAGSTKTAVDRYNDFAALRLNSDGTPDTGFGDQGVRVVPFDLANDNSADDVSDMTLIGGRVLITGLVASPDGGSFALTRLDSDQIFCNGFELP